MLDAFSSGAEHRSVIETALRIRVVENALFDLFGQGKLHGTIHTCVGQEFSGVIVGRHLREGDFITSNHRCHGHFIAATGNWKGLVDELIGNADGICSGIGSSQHLCASNFLSNGQQAGLVPVAAGIALDRKLAGRKSIAISFIGEGTLGEGVLYETMNISSLWGLSHLIVCENNGYSQSTPQALSVAGEIGARAAAFGMKVFQADTWDLAVLDRTVAEAMTYVREQNRPSFLVIRSYRLNPHSRGDDLRSAEELSWFRDNDPLNRMLKNSGIRVRYEEIVAEVEAYIADALEKPTLNPDIYRGDQLPRRGEVAPQWVAVAPRNDNCLRGAGRLNSFYREWLRRDAGAVMLGEDIADPYGGAFKITKGLPSEFPGRVITTPISEAAITGIGIGLSVAGRRAIVEIMFGDFVTYAFDQIVNNASKFFHMYNRQVTCPVVVRTPMGGRRGYGPTHSQSLERFLIGIDNVAVLSLNTLVDPATQLAGLETLEGPALLLENKIDYTVLGFEAPEGFVIERDGASFPTLRVRPCDAEADVTILSYGGMARYVGDRLFAIFEQSDLVPELLAPTTIHPLPLEAILDSVRRTGRLAVVEEGASFGSVGAEVIAQVQEVLGNVRVTRIAAAPLPIPSVPALEDAALPSLARICASLRTLS